MLSCEGEEKVIKFSGIKIILQDLINKFSNILIHRSLKLKLDLQSIVLINGL